MRIKGDTEPAKMLGYEILDHLYETGPRTVEEIGNHTGLPYRQVIDNLRAFIQQGLVERVAEL